MSSSRRSWNYTTFCQESHKRPDIDFTFVRPEHVTSSTSQIPCRCRQCGYDWYTKVNYLFNTKRSGCPRCAGNIPWTLSRLLYEAPQKWPTTDFSLVKNGDIMNNMSYIFVRCRICGIQRNTQICVLIGGKGCPTCSNCEKWTRERIKRELIPVYCHKYYFLDIEWANVVNKNSLFRVFDFNCGHTWVTNVSKVLRGTGCPFCSINRRWSYDVLMESIKNLHPNFDLGQNTRESFNGVKTVLNLRCELDGCGYQWKTSVVSVLHRGSGCPNCSNRRPWTLQRLQEKSGERNDIDFSLVSPTDIGKGAHGKISCRCRTCNFVWKASIHSIFNSGRGCPICCASKGERAITNLLTQANIPFEREVVLESLPRKRFDFRFHYNNRAYLLEFDGEQHFTQNDFHHDDEAHFREKQVVDVVKSQHAYQNGYFLIRIDYTQIDNIREHLHRALTSTERYYLSNPEMYAYLFMTTVASI